MRILPKPAPLNRLAMAWLLAALAWHVAAARPSDAELDASVHALSQQLRCLVCQNQTLADSNAELAVDLRRQIRAQLAQGTSDRDIKAYLVQRYGDFVLYDPPFRPSTWLLWLGPFALLLGVAGWIWRRRRGPPSPRPASRMRQRNANPRAHLPPTPGRARSGPRPRFA